MAIVAKNVIIPTSEDSAIVKGLDVDKIVANGVVVWEKVVTKNAPPFLSAGWRTLRSKHWVAVGYDSSNGITSYHIVSEDDDTRYIGENEISAFYWSDSTQLGYLFLYPTIISTSAYSEISTSVEVQCDDDTSEGRAWFQAFVVSRFSDNKSDWTYWTGRSTPDRAYKYAQVGYFYGGNSDSAVSMWFSCKISSFTFH